MAYITQAYIESMIGSADANALVDSPVEMAASIALATALVESALQSGGYSARADTYAADSLDCPELIRVITYSAWLRHASARRNIEVPEVIYDAYDQIKHLRDGSIEIAGVSRSVVRSMGGITSTSTEDYPRVFRNLRTR